MRTSIRPNLNLNSDMDEDLIRLLRRRGRRGSGLLKSNFVSLYGSADSYEDFAETFAMLVLEKTRGFEYSIELPTGKTVSLGTRISGEKLKTKKDFLFKLIQKLEKKELRRSGN